MSFATALRESFRGSEHVLAKVAMQKCEQCGTAIHARSGGPRGLRTRVRSQCPARTCPSTARILANAAGERLAGPQRLLAGSRSCLTSGCCSCSAPVRAPSNRAFPARMGGLGLLCAERSHQPTGRAACPSHGLGPGLGSPPDRLMPALPFQPPTCMSPCASSPAAFVGV